MKEPFSAGAVKRHTAATLYAQIADQLTEQIRSGRLSPGARLPSEHALMAEYGVSRVTVREALKRLEAQGLVVRRRAKGTFVALRVRHDVTAFAGFYESLVSSGVRPETALLDFRRVVTDPHVRAKLGHDEALLLLRSYSRGGYPFAVAHLHLHPDALVISRDEAERLFCYDILRRRLGRQIARADLSVRAGRAGEGPARLLGLSADDPIVALERVSYDEHDAPLEHAVFYFDADAYELDLTLRSGIEIAQSIRPSAR